jgi:predicted acetyltransferase
MSMDNAMDFFGDGSILYHVIQYKENRPAISLNGAVYKCKNEMQNWRKENSIDDIIDMVLTI